MLRLVLLHLQSRVASKGSAPAIAVSCFTNFIYTTILMSCRFLTLFEIRISRFVGEWGQEIVPASAMLAMVPQFTLAEVASRLWTQGFPFKRSICFSDAQRVALSSLSLSLSLCVINSCLLVLGQHGQKFLSQKAPLSAQQISCSLHMRGINRYSNPRKPGQKLVSRWSGSRWSKQLGLMSEPQSYNCTSCSPSHRTAVRLA